MIKEFAEFSVGETHEAHVSCEFLLWKLETSESIEFYVSALRQSAKTAISDCCKIDLFGNKSLLKLEMILSGKSYYQVSNLQEPSNRAHKTSKQQTQTISSGDAANSHVNGDTKKLRMKWKPIPKKCMRNCSAKEAPWRVYT